MKKREKVRSKMRMAAGASLTLAVVLSVFLIYGVTSELPQAPGEVQQMAQASTRFSLLANQLFLVVMPFVVAFLAYLSIMISLVLRSVGRVRICSHKSPSCGYDRKFFDFTDTREKEPATASSK